MHRTTHSWRLWSVLATLGCTFLATPLFYAVVADDASRGSVETFEAALTFHPTTDVSGQPSPAGHTQVGGALSCGGETFRVDGNLADFEQTRTVTNSFLLRSTVVGRHEPIPERVLAASPVEDTHDPAVLHVQRTVEFELHRTADGWCVDSMSASPRLIAPGGELVESDLYELASKYAADTDGPEVAKLMDAAEGDDVQALIDHLEAGCCSLEPAEAEVLLTMAEFSR